ncbi:MAG: cystathionine gamma-synthase [Acidobacteriota bacterium]
MPSPCPRSPTALPFSARAPRFATRLVRSGLESDAQHGAVVPPIHLSSTFSFADLGEPRRFDYTRSGNPTRCLLAEALSAAEGGAGTTITATGMAAITVVASLLEPGEVLAAPIDCYGGSHRLFSTLHESRRLEVVWFDPDRPATLDAAFERRPRLVWVETPSNPLLRISDLGQILSAARRVGAWVAVDNTFLSPARQNPLRLGADFAVHSTTKYINGHSDVVGGAVVSATAELAERVDWWANCLGLTGSPFDSYLTLRGLRTLGARLAVHEANAQAIAELLLAQPAVERVYYPGLEEHPGHHLACQQQSGFGAMISFELRGGREAVRRFVSGLRYWSLAESLGGVESLIAHPASMTHVVMSEEDRRCAGIGDGLLRLSVGIEDVADLASDLRAGFDRV